jgi:hypothetical protein
MWARLRDWSLALCVCLAFAACSAEISKVGDGDDGGVPDADPFQDPPIDATVPDAIPVVAPDAVVPAPCVEGDTQVFDDTTGNCYFAVYTLSGGVTWQEAVDACVVAGGELPIITDQATQDFVTQLAVQAAATGVDNHDIWLGATDAVVEMEWRWHDGELIGPYLGWRENEPNNGGATGNEDCMIMEGDKNGTWDDRPCASSYGYVCIRPPEGRPQ